MRTGTTAKFAGQMALLLILIGAGSSRALGAVSVSLPLGGYYRPGKYMPVRIVTTGPSAPVLLQADGAVTTRFEPAAKADVILPWLIVSQNAAGVRWVSGSEVTQSIERSLRPLNEDERLLAVIGADPQTAASLFPGKNVIPIALEPSGSLHEPIQAWQTLDGVVLGTSAAARLTNSQIALLLAGGTSVAVASSDRPDSRWPWSQAGSLWVLRPVSEAASFGIDSDAYAPTYDWDRGWPAPFRARVVFAGALVCLLGTAVAMWRSRHAVWGVVGFCAVAIGLIAWWTARQSPVLEKSVETSARAEGLVQEDRWSFRSPLRGATVDLPVSNQGLTGPVFSSGRQLAELKLELECGADGTPSRFSVHLERGQTMAFLTRIVRRESGVAAGRR